jgi:RNA polymerase sigma-70 factor (ECF subfamily)
MDLAQEKELISRARKDPSAFGQLFEEYYAPIFGYTLRRVGNLEAAQDITSGVFFKALKNLWQFHWRNIHFSSWLYRIAANEVNYYFRARGYKTISLDMLLENQGFEVADTALDVAENLRQAQDELERHQDFLKVQKLLRQLPPKYQETLALRFFERKTIAEISAILGKKEGTIKSLISRGLTRLRECLAPEKPEIMQPFEVSSIIGSGGRDPIN